MLIWQFFKEMRELIYEMVQVFWDRGRIIYFCCQSVRFVIASFHHSIMTYWVLKLPYFAQFWPPTHILGNWPKITNIQLILTLPSTLTSLLLPLIYLCKFIMNISKEKGRCSRISKIELYVNFYGGLRPSWSWFFEIINCTR